MMLKQIINFVTPIIPDKLYIKMKYFYHTKQSLNLKNPKMFNEKIQWLKLYDRKNEYTTYVDKYLVRRYISEKIGEKYLIPLISVYNTVEDINWEEIPNQFVLKCNHGSQCNIICVDKQQLDIENAKIKLKKWLNKSWYWYGREWPYKNVKPKIVCEKYMADESGNELKDYKFFCFNGKVRFIQVDYDRFTNHCRNIYDVNWKHININYGYKTNLNKKIKKPVKFNEMIRIAEKLSEDKIFVRVDLYDVKGKIFFGELTFYPGSGFEKFNPIKWDYIFGKYIDISKYKRN